MKQKTAAEIELEERTRPRSYDLSNPEERERLLRESVGYAMVGLKYGTDTEGRRYAYEALNRAFRLGFRLTLPDPAKAEGKDAP